MKSEQAKIASKPARSAASKKDGSYLGPYKCDVRNDMSVGTKKDVVMEFVLLNLMICLCRRADKCKD